MTLKIFYSEKQSAENKGAYSPSAGKPKKIVAHWRDNEDIEIVEPRPVTLKQLCAAHHKSYVEGILNRTISNGFGNKDAAVAKSLPWTSGSFLAAARHAIKTGTVACSPTSGFHHACYGSKTSSGAGGFCTFNGLMVAALALKKSGDATTVGIIDLDEHFGNGTADIIAKKKITWIEHLTLGGTNVVSDKNKYYRSKKSLNSATDFLKNLPKYIEDHFSGCEVIFYQAGADSCIHDPLGGVFTNEQMRERDRIVFETCFKLGIPVVWNLAGGYQNEFQNVLDLHTATLEECLKVYAGLIEEYENGLLAV